MNVLPFIPKDDAALPDEYGMKILYLDGKSEDYEVGSHFLGEKLFEFVTKDDIWHWVPLTAVKRIEFDKRFSKVVEIRSRQKAESKIKE